MMAQSKHPGLGMAPWLSLFVLFVGAAPAAGQSAAEVRAVLQARVGDVTKLQVPASVSDFPQPRLADGTIDPRFAITPEKVRLGKLLFFDPVRSNHIRPEFGGVPETSQTASCGSCHIGEAASKAGTLVSVGVGGEGRHTTDIRGNQTIIRAPIAGLVDILPTPVEEVDALGIVVQSGRFDAVDAPGRVAPSCIGFAFNNRLLWGGEAGEPNPEGYPAQEDIVRKASGAHRMANPDFSHLQGNAVYRELFAAAFPEENQAHLASGNLDDLINLDTQFRAIAAFLRTAITRDTPWDRFLAGDNNALTPRQLAGAFLFAAPVADGGANCIACHSGPALNKLLGDEDGLLIEENFFNLGTPEHPLVALARSTLGDPDVFDVGRMGVTGDPLDAFAYKTPTLRQLKDSAPFFHGGGANSVREVVEYFNAGEPINLQAAQAGNLPMLFQFPRGAGTTGLGLSPESVDALVDFLEDGLYDAGFIHQVPGSPTETFELNVIDLTYTDALKALGSRDGWLPSNMANGFNDEKSRAQLIFIRGNANGDARVDIADSIFILSYLFSNGPEPNPMVAADVNDDGRTDLSDPIYLLNSLFRGAAQPPLPFPDAGQDLTK